MQSIDPRVPSFSWFVLSPDPHSFSGSTPTIGKQALGVFHS